MAKILICGPLPEPIGGVSVHTKRLSDLLSKADIKVALCDESRQIKEAIPNIRNVKTNDYLKLIRNSDVIHIHSSVGIFRITHLLISSFFGKKIVVTIHSWRSGKLHSIFWASVLNTLCDKIVFVSPELSKRLRVKESKLLIFPAFIPPQAQALPLPAEILSFIDRSRKNNKTILSSNAFRLVLHGNQDLYGLDICIEALSNPALRENAVLIYVISDPTVNVEKIRKYEELISRQNLMDTVLLHCGAIDFYGLLRASDISIRATNTDGDALSIRESIYLGIPCIASDCVDRPKEAITFRNRSASSLTKVILANLKTPPTPPGNNEEEILMFYKKLYQDI